MTNRSTEINKILSPVRIAQALFVILGAIWIVFGVSSLVRMAASSTDPTITMWVIALLMFGNAGALLLIGWGLVRRPKFFYYLGILILVVNIILTVTDEFGMFDLITLMIDLALLVFLIVTRSRYVSGNEN